MGVSHEPTKAVITTVNNVAKYSAGIAGGEALKFAVKLPNFVMLSFVSDLSGFPSKKSKEKSKKEDGDANFMT